jgi:hypothetical protein
MNRSQIKACRENEIRRLASYHDGDFAAAKKLYNRLVRFSLRFYRWATINCSEKPTGYRLKQHVREGLLLGNMHDKLTSDLQPYGLHIDYPGLYPTIYSEHNDHACELFWY